MKLQDFDFRVWDNQRKEYINDYVGIFKLFVNGKRTIETHELPNGFENEFNLIDNGELELYSGYKDKNGVKIYDGDIVRFTHRKHRFLEEDENLKIHFKNKALKKSFIAEIFYLSLERSYNRIGIEYGNFDTGYSFFIPRKYKIKNKDGQWGDCNTIFSLFELSFVFDFKFEVIGNIHENSELLKGVK